MKLRTRIALTTWLCFSLLTLGLWLEGNIRQGAIIHLYQQAMVQGYQRALEGISLAMAHDMGTVLDRLASRPLPTSARDEVELRQLRLELPAGDSWQLGWLLESNSGVRHGQGPPELLEDSLRRAILDNHPLTGWVSRGDRSYFITAAPIIPRFEVLGVALCYLSVEIILDQLAASTGDTVLLMSTDYQLMEIAGADESQGERLWAQLKGTSLPTADGVHLATLAGRYWLQPQVYTVAQWVIHDVFEQPRWRLLAVRDVSAAYRHYQLISVLSLGATIIAVTLFCAGLFWYLRQAFSPLNEVIAVLNAIARGNTQVAIAAPQRADEIGRLSATVERFRQGQRAKAQLAVIRQELETATQIQRAIQPRHFPEQADYEVYACLETAREVGGDFFDFFDLPDGRFGFVVADVSDKGIGAALFMAIARTVLRTTALIRAEPSECLSRANDYLSVDNATAMFVTLFYGVLDPDTGEVVYANAGHPDPYRVSANGVEVLASTNGIALGAIEALTYDQASCRLAPGELLVLYTDGVTEAQNSAAEQFGEAGLERELRRLPRRPEALVEGIKEQVIAFSGGKLLFDDMTLLVLQYRPKATAPQRPLDAAVEEPKRLRREADETD